MEIVAYPKWVYKDGEGVIVQNEEEHKALLESYRDSPVPKAPEEVVPKQRRRKQ